MFNKLAYSAVALTVSLGIVMSCQAEATGKDYASAFNQVKQINAGDLNVDAFNGTGVGFRIKSARNRGGFIRDITVQNLRLMDVRFPVLIQLNWFPQYSYGDQSNLSDKPEHWRKLADGVEGEAGLTAVSGLTIKNMTARRSDNKYFSRAFFIEGYPERPVTGLTLDGILIDASEFGKISGVDGLRFKDVQVTAVENTQDRNDSYER